MQRGQHLYTWHWKEWVSTCRRPKLSSDHSPYTKVILKWIKDLNVILETTTGKHRENAGRCRHKLLFSNRTSIAQEIRARADMYIKGNNYQNQENPIEWEKILPASQHIKEFYLDIRRSQKN
jgi:hypothetical protein